MSGVVNAHFAGMPLTEVVPAATRVSGVSKSSILSGRRRVRFQAQTGTTANAGNIVQFVLADSTCLLDAQSVVLSCNVNTTGTGASMDDGPSFLRRIQVTFNGSLLEDCDNAHRNANALVYLGASKSWVESAGTFAGYWKDVPALGSSAAAYTAVAGTYAKGMGALIDGDVVGAAVNASVRTTAAAVATMNGNIAGMSYGVPLGLVSGVFRTSQYIPLSQCGEMVLQLTLAQASEAIFQVAGSTDGAYTLSDIYLEADLVTPNYLYGQMLNMICQDENEPGLVIPIETTIVSQGQSIAGTAIESSIIQSRATNNLRKIVVTCTPTNALADINYPSVSCFPNANFQQVQWRIGSLYFPSQPANSLGRAFWMSVGSFNNSEPLNVYDGVINWNTYGNTTIYAASGAGLVYLPATYNTGQLRFADKFVLAYNFDNFKGGETLDADGVSILGQSGAQIVTQLRNSPSVIGSGGLTPTVSLLATKYLHLKNGALKIVGA
jgi:hypothetical protein